MLIDSNLNLSLQKSEDPIFSSASRISPSPMGTLSAPTRTSSCPAGTSSRPMRTSSRSAGTSSCPMRIYFHPHENFRASGKAFPACTKEITRGVNNSSEA